MTHRHTLLVASVVVAMLVSPTILAQETATATRNTTNESETAGMGAQLTAFTQSSSAAVNDSVENGMWQAGFNQSNASERTRLVRDRTGTLEQRLDRLQRQNESLQERYENGSLPETAYIAQQSRLSARIDGLRTAINDTDEAAAAAGVNDSRLERLRQNASELRGPEVAAIARGLGGGPPEDRGPPDDRGERGPPADRSDRGPPANRTQGGGSPGPGGGNAAGNGSNATGGGQPGATDAGNASGGGQSGATDAGNATGGGDATDSTSSGDTGSDSTNESGSSNGGQNDGSNSAGERGNDRGQGSDAPGRS